MKALTIAVLFLSPTIAFGQRHELEANYKIASGHSQLAFVEGGECDKQGSRLAENDLAKGLVLLLLQSGVAPVAYSTDEKFEQKFGARYFEEGCRAPAAECMKAYNARVFQYLERNYGRAWRKDVRKDVVGLTEWKKSIKS